MAPSDEKRRSSRRRATARQPDASGEELEFILRWLPCLFCLAFLLVIAMALYLSANESWIAKQRIQSQREPEASEEDYDEF